MTCLPVLRLAAVLCLFGIVSCVSTATSATTTPGVTTSPANTGTLLQQSTLYPRVLRIAHGSTLTNGRIIASTNGIIFQSLDRGISFTRISQVPTIPGSSERCCATLYELPQRVGRLAAGTLLSAASYLVGAVPAIEIYVSADAGLTWSYLATPVVRGSSKHGLWEPQFEVANDGALVIFWSDETNPCCSQKIVQSRTYDGALWKDEIDTVASTAPTDRPGMPIVSKLPNGHFFMSYEVCGTAACTVFARTSSDGWNFGKPADLGTRIVSTSGLYLEHAPLNTWAPSPTSTTGTLLLVGQVLYEATGSISPKNGQLIFVNSSADGAGAWSTIVAPVFVPTAYDNFCPNYSSALLPSIDGASLLELASYYNPAGICLTYFNTGPLH